MILYTLISLFISKFFLSNFVFTNEVDNLIYPSSDLVTRCRINFCFYHKDNVFQTSFDNETFHVYLVCKAKEPEFHICGTDGEPERLLALIREKRERGETVTLPLTFEGKYVGIAKVLKT